MVAMDAIDVKNKVNVKLGIEGARSRVNHAVGVMAVGTDGINRKHLITASRLTSVNAKPSDKKGTTREGARIKIQKTNTSQDEDDESDREEETAQETRASLVLKGGITTQTKRRRMPQQETRHDSQARDQACGPGAGSAS